MSNGVDMSFGPTAVLEAQGIEILLITRPIQIFDLEQWRAFGIEPTEKSVIALKSMAHFRAAYSPIAAGIVICDGGALCSPNLADSPFKRVPRPIFPLDG